MLPSRLFAYLLQAVSSDLQMFLQSDSVINKMMESMGNAYLASVIWDELSLKKYGLFNVMFKLGLNLT